MNKNLLNEMRPRDVLRAVWLTGSIVITGSVEEAPAWVAILLFANLVSAAISVNRIKWPESWKNWGDEA